MAFEKEKAEIRERLSDLQKKELIYLACVVVKDQEQSRLRFDRVKIDKLLAERSTN